MPNLTREYTQEEVPGNGQILDFQMPKADTGAVNSKIQSLQNKTNEKLDRLNPDPTLDMYNNMDITEGKYGITQDSLNTYNPSQLQGMFGSSVNDEILYDDKELGPYQMRQDESGNWDKVPFSGQAEHLYVAPSKDGNMKLGLASIGFEERYTPGLAEEEGYHRKDGKPIGYAPGEKGVDPTKSPYLDIALPADEAKRLEFLVHSNKGQIANRAGGDDLKSYLTNRKDDVYGSGATEYTTQNAPMWNINSTDYSLDGDVVTPHSPILSGSPSLEQEMDRKIASLKETDDDGYFGNLVDGLQYSFGKFAADAGDSIVDAGIRLGKDTAKYFDPNMTEEKANKILHNKLSEIVDKDGNFNLLDEYKTPEEYGYDNSRTEAIMKDLAHSVKKGSAADVVKSIVYGVATGGPQFLVESSAYMLAASNPVGMFAAVLGMANSSMEEIQKNTGLKDIGYAKRAQAVLGSAAQMYLERLGVDELIGRTDYVQRVFNVALKNGNEKVAAGIFNAYGKAVAKVAGKAIYEGLEEIPQNMIQDFTEKFGTKAQKDLTIENELITSVQGFTGGVGAGGFVAGAHRVGSSVLGSAKDQKDKLEEKLNKDNIKNDKPKETLNTIEKEEAKKDANAFIRAAHVDPDEWNKGEVQIDKVLNTLHEMQTLKAVADETNDNAMHEEIAKTYEPFLNYVAENKDKIQQAIADTNDNGSKGSDKEAEPWTNEDAYKVSSMLELLDATGVKNEDAVKIIEQSKLGDSHKEEIINALNNEHIRNAYKVSSAKSINENIGNILNKSLSRKVESKELSDKEQLKHLKDIQQEYVDAITNIGKKITNKPDGQTDYVAGLNHVIEQFNNGDKYTIEMLTGIENKSRVKIDSADVLNHLSNLNNKIEDTTHVGSTYKTIINSNRQVSMSAKKAGVRLETAGQKGHLNRLSNSIEELGKLRAKLETGSADESVDIASKIKALESKINDMIENSTLFDEDMMRKRLQKKLEYSKNKIGYVKTIGQASKLIGKKLSKKSKEDKEVYKTINYKGNAKKDLNWSNIKKDILARAKKTGNRLDIKKLDSSIYNAKKILNSEKSTAKNQVRQIESSLRALNNGWYRGRKNSAEVVRKMLDALDETEKNAEKEIEELNKKEKELSDVIDNGIVISNKKASKINNEVEKSGKIDLSEKDEYIAAQNKEKEKIQVKKAKAEKNINSIKKAKEEISGVSPIVNDIVNKHLSEHNGELNKTSANAIIDDMMKSFHDLISNIIYNYEEHTNENDELLKIISKYKEYNGDYINIYDLLVQADKIKDKNPDLSEELQKKARGMLADELSSYSHALKISEDIVKELTPIHVTKTAEKTINEKVKNINNEPIAKISKQIENLSEIKNKQIEQIEKTVSALHVAKVAKQLNIDKKTEKVLRDVIKKLQNKLNTHRKALQGKDSSNQINNLIKDTSIRALIWSRAKNGEVSKEKTGGLGNLLSKYFSGSSSSINKTLKDYLDTSLNLDELVELIPTLSTTIDFKKENSSPFIQIAKNVNEDMKHSFYSDKAKDLDYWLLARNAVQFSLMEPINPDAALSPENIKINDHAAVALYTTAQSIIDEDFFSWVGWKDVEQINKFFDIDSKNMEKGTAGIYKKLRHAYPTKMVYEKAGKKFAKELGFNPNKKQMSETQKAEMYSQLGHFIVTYMKSKGYLDTKEIPIDNKDRAKLLGTKPEEGNKTVYNFIQSGSKYRGTNGAGRKEELLHSPEREAYLELMTTDRSKNIMDYEWASKVPDKAKNTSLDSGVADDAKNAIENAQKEAYALNVDVADKLLEEFEKLEVVDQEIDEVLNSDVDIYKDENAAKQFFSKFGVMIPSDIKNTPMLFRNKNIAMEKYNNFIQAIDHLSGLRKELDTITKEINSNKDMLGIDGEIVPSDIKMYSKYFYSKNGRFFMDLSGGMNPQTEKEISRWLLTPKELETSIDTKTLNIVGSSLSTGNMFKDYSKLISNYNNVVAMDTLIGIAMGFGVSIDKEFTAKSVAIGYALFNKSEKELIQLSEKLSNNEDVEIEYSYRMVDWKTGKLTSPKKDTFKIGKEHEMQRSVILDALIKSKYDKAVTIPYELDGVTNGTYFKTGEAPVIAEYQKMLNKTGTYFEDDTINGTKFKDLKVRPLSQDVIAMARTVNQNGLPESSRLNKDEKKQYADAYISILESFEDIKPEDSANKIAENTFYSRTKSVDSSEVSIYSPLAISIHKYKNIKSFMPSSKDEQGMVTKAFRDFVKYPKMIFDYGGLLFNIRKAFVHDLVYEVADNILNDIDSALNELMIDGSDKDKVLKDHSNLLSILINNPGKYTKDMLTKTLEKIKIDLQQDGWESVVEYQIDKKDLSNGISTTIAVNGKIIEYKIKKYPPKLYDMLYDVLDGTDGSQLSKSLIETSGVLIDYNNLLNNSAKWIGHIYKQKLEDAINLVRNENARRYAEKIKDVDSTVKSSTFDPSLEQMEWILVQLDEQGFTPVVDTPYNDGKSFIELIDSKIDSAKTTQVQMPLADKDKGHIQKTVSTILKSPAVVNALASVADTHFSDGATMAELMNKYPIVGVHDATVLNGNIASDVTRSYGSKSWEIMMNHNPLSNYIKKLANVARKLTDDEIDRLDLTIEQSNKFEQPIVQQSFSYFDLNGNLIAKDYSQILNESIGKKDIEIADIDMIVEDAKKFNNIVVKNKNNMINKNVYITQFAGSANGEYISNPGSISSQVNELDSLDISAADSAIDINPSESPEKEIGSTAKEKLVKQLLIEKFRELLMSAYAESDPSTTKDIKARVKLIKSILERHGFDTLYDNIINGLVDYVMFKQNDGKLPENLTNKDILEIKSFISKPSVGKSSSAANSANAGALAIDLYNEVVSPSLKKENLLDLSNNCI